MDNTDSQLNDHAITGSNKSDVCLRNAVDLIINGQKIDFVATFSSFFTAATVSVNCDRFTLSPLVMCVHT